MLNYYKTKQILACNFQLKRESWLLTVLQEEASILSWWGNSKQMTFDIKSTAQHLHLVLRV